MSSPLVVYGAGGHGTVVADAAVCAGFEVLGFLDDGRPVGDVSPFGKVLGGAGWWRAHPGVAVALAVGDNAIRQRLLKALTADGVEAMRIVHPRAVVSRAATLERGVAIFALAVVNPGAHIGAGAIINSGAVVEHDVRIGECAHVASNATLAGAASLGDLSLLGSGACVLPGINIGERSIVGAGAVVTRDIPARSVCTGIPAKVIRESPNQ